MKQHPLFLVSTLLLVGFNAFSQRISDEEVIYNYIKLPLAPFDNSVKNYQSKIDAPFEEKNAQLKAEYEQKLRAADEQFEKDKAAYPALVQEAEDTYKKELEEYNKKSFGEKVVEKKILGENNKPVKQLPYQPYLKSVEKPNLRTSFDYPVMANTYLFLDGYSNNAANPVTILVTAYGFDYTPPKVLSEQKSKTSISNGTSSTYQVTEYHIEFSYRFPMAVKVTSPDGKELMNITPPEFNEYQLYKTPASTTIPPLNEQMLIKTYEEKAMQNNLTAINEIVNDKYGYRRTSRKIEINYVKSKGEEYVDLMTAFNEVSSGLKILVEDETNAKAKISKAIDLWTKALLESEPTNKKARIDKNVTIAICFNLLEAYFATRNVAGGLEIVQKLNSLDISSKERKRKDEYEASFNDLKQRILNQK